MEEKEVKQEQENVVEEATPSNVKRAVKRYRKQRIRLTTSNVNEEVIGQAYIEGKITSKDWSLMSPALRKVCERYAKKHKQVKKVDTVESSEE